jgi:hypothetical protein
VQSFTTAKIQFSFAVVFEEKTVKPSSKHRIISLALLSHHHSFRSAYGGLPKEWWRILSAGELLYYLTGGLSFLSFTFGFLLSSGKHFSYWVLLYNAFSVKHCNSLPCFNIQPFPFIIVSLNRRHSNYRVLRLLLTSVDTKLYRYKSLTLKDALHLSPRYLQISQSRFINFRFIPPLHLNNIIPYSRGLLFL